MRLLMKCCSQQFTERVLQILPLPVRLTRSIPLIRWRTPDCFGVPLPSNIFSEVETVPTGTCPECDADVHVDSDADKGDSVLCDECGTELEVVGLDPLELDIAEEEDLDDDEEDDDF
jgi:alpha-aminoadipate/glutamate carrier protein LysW